MIVLVSLIVLLRGLPCFHHFLHGASHPYFPIHSYLHLFYIHIFCKRNYAHAYMCRLARAALYSRVSLVKWRRNLALHEAARVHSCRCYVYFISCVDFVKRHCVWEREAVW